MLPTVGEQRAGSHRRVGAVNSMIVALRRPQAGWAILGLCQQHDVRWVPFFPLGSAFPGIAKVTEHPSVTAAAQELGVTPAQVGLAWLLAHDSGTLLIPGTSSVDHLEENVAAGSVRLGAEMMSVLDGLALTHG
jgi:pyridoxine 4-dehydrogenase